MMSGSKSDPTQLQDKQTAQRRSLNAGQLAPLSALMQGLGLDAKFHGDSC